MATQIRVGPTVEAATLLGSSPPSLLSVGAPLSTSPLSVLAVSNAGCI